MGVTDICIIVILALGALIGFKKGAIKSFVQLVGLIAIIIVAYQFKGILGSLLIKYMPFFNFGGIFKDIYTINFLLYQGLGFIVIFILLYCALNILINLSGFLDKLVKLTIIFELPSKIIGAILGTIEAVMFIFVLSFILLQIPSTQKYVMESKIARPIVERTPIVNQVFRLSTVAAGNAYNVLIEHKGDENKNEANLELIRIFVQYGIVDASVVQDNIDNGKLRMVNAVVVS